ncbi:stage III sporulation protein AC [Clostridium collagenovorans DSM 3089]|uniref:Stage III sporulation protein AC n=1 Tax=Clostridium collagenovorans DSM 3089 TaxID=1121306 RepID=A0A1M5T4J1_9CLOT|nr:stage III sporulation protein AC [Clostridium collagenovorans]SHH45293.1 stage III sporulation protein AC [Clostridium collagenovorans DSM 3089]
MLDIGLIFKIAAVGILVLVLDKLLTSSGKGEYAAMTNLVGVIIILMMVINLIGKLFTTVKTIFTF